MDTSNAQSSVEYIVIYGWALVILAIVVAILFYSLSIPKTITPNTCTFSSSLLCSDIVIGSNQITGLTIITFQLSNGQPYPIANPTASVNIDGVNTSYVACSPALVLPGGTALCSIQTAFQSSLGQFASGGIYVIVGNCGLIANYSATHVCANPPTQTYSGTFSGHAEVPQILSTSTTSSTSSTSTSSASTTTILTTSTTTSTTSTTTTTTTTICGSYAYINNVTTNPYISFSDALYDSVNGYVYTVGQGNSGAGVASAIYGTNDLSGPNDISLYENYPSYISYNTSSGKVYIPDGAPNTGGNVSILSGNSLVQNVVVGGNLNIPAYDPVNGYLYVANQSSYQSTIYALSGSSVTGMVGGFQAVVGQPHAVGGNPEWMTVDPQNGDLYVPMTNVNAHWGNVIVVSGTSFVANIVLNQPGGGLQNTDAFAAYNPNNNYMYVSTSDGGSYGNVIVISGLSNIANIDLPSIHSDPSQIVYDPTNNYMYVSDAGTSANEIYVISGTSDIANIPMPPSCNPGWPAVAANGDVFVPCRSAGSVVVISGTSIIQTLPAVLFNPIKAVYNSQNGDVYVPTGWPNVTVIGCI